MTRPVPFCRIPMNFTGAVYAAELTNGMVKVGYSRNPRTRMSSLDNQCSRFFGARVARYYIGPNAGDLVARRVERAVLDRLSMIATSVRRRREYFLHTTFGAAANLVRQMSAQRELAGARNLWVVHAAISPQASQSAITPICSPSQPSN